MICKRSVADLFILFTEIVTENSQVIFFFLLKHYNISNISTSIAAKNEFSQ